MTGAPTRAATCLTRSVTNLVTAGCWPTVRGQMPSSQRAILPVVWVGVTKEATNCATASGWVGGRGGDCAGCAAAAPSAASNAAQTLTQTLAQTLAIRTIFYPHFFGPMGPCRDRAMLLLQG